MNTAADETLQQQKVKTNWDFSDLGIVLITLGLISVGVSLMAQSIKHILGAMMSPKTLAVYFFVLVNSVQAVVVSLVVLALVRNSRSNLKSLGLRYTNQKSLILGVFTGLGLLALGLVTNAVINGFWPQTQPQPIAKAIMSAHSGWQLGWLVLVGSVLAPCSEELVYRGFSLPLFSKFTQGSGALWLNGLFFALMHFDLYRFIPLAIAGFSLNWLYRKTNSLYPTMIAHGLWNGIMTLLVFLNLTL